MNKLQPLLNHLGSLNLDAFRQIVDHIHARPQLFEILGDTSDYHSRRFITKALGWENGSVAYAAAQPEGCLFLKSHLTSFGFTVRTQYREKDIDVALWHIEHNQAPSVGVFEPYSSSYYTEPVALIRALTCDADAFVSYLSRRFVPLE